MTRPGNQLTARRSPAVSTPSTTSSRSRTTALLVSAATGIALLSVVAWLGPRLLDLSPASADSTSWVPQLRVAAVAAAEWALWGLLLAAALLVLALISALGSSHRSGPPRGPAGQTSRLSGWLRRVLVVAVVLVVAGAAYGWLTAPAATTAAVKFGLTCAASAVAAVFAWRWTDAMLTRRHRRQWVLPLHAALTRALQLPTGTKPGSYLYVSPRFTEREGLIARVKVPVEWNSAGTGTADVAAAVKSKLALSDVTFRWRHTGLDPQVEVFAAPRAPGRVLFADPAVRELVRVAPESAPLIGLSHRGQVVAVDLDAESPHILVSASTGGGKSVLLRTLFSQFLHNGAQGVVLDIKRHSHKWVRGIPGVEYCRDIEDMDDALVRLRAEAHRRNRIVDEWEGDEVDAPVGPRIVVLVEEANATIGRLKKHWQVVREKEDPKDSPAIDSLMDLLFLGRAVGMNVLLVAQSATAAALGGPEARENFATRILARYTQNAWRMLVPEVSPIPKSTRHVGRAQVVLGGQAHETQVLYMSPEEAHDWAVAGSSQVSVSQTAPVAADLAKPGETVAPSWGTGAAPARRLQLVHSPGAVSAVPPAPPVPPASYVHSTPAVPSAQPVLDGSSASGVGDVLPGPPVPPAQPVLPVSGVPAVAEPDAGDESGSSAAPPPVRQMLSSVRSPAEVPVTLREAVDAGVLGCSLAVARKSASGRDTEFPAPVTLRNQAKLYRPLDLRRWERNRPKAGAGSEAI